MPLLIGLVAALAVGVFARATGLDRDRGFYPTVMIVIALLYVLFAVMSATPRVLLAELAVATVFVVMAVAGFRGSLWLVAAALAGHGVLDLVHGRFISNPGVPDWWAPWCLGYDVVAGLMLAWLLRTRRLPATS